MDLKSLFPNINERVYKEIITATIETILMTSITAVIAGLLGLIVGILLVVTRKDGILENLVIHNIVDKVINTFRSIPFLILSMQIIPFTRFIVNTSIGLAGAVVPLVVATIPFFARQVQLALLEVDDGVVEASIAMGLSPLEIIYRVYLKEGLPSLIRASSLTLISLIGLTTMAGAVGGGGIGNLAISRGYNRFQSDVIFICTLITMTLVFTCQAVGNYLEKRTTK